jgi:hypothetical protein
VSLNFTRKRTKMFVVYSLRDLTKFRYWSIGKISKLTDFVALTVNTVYFATKLSELKHYLSRREALFLLDML